MSPTTGERSDIPQIKHISCTTRSRQSLPLTLPTYHHHNVLLTTWGRQGVTIFLAPPHWVDVRRGDVTPVVVHILPAIKMHQDLVTQDVRHSGHTNQDCVLAIHSLQLHPYAECAGSHRLLEKGWQLSIKSSVSELWVVACTITVSENKETVMSDWNSLPDRVLKADCVGSFMIYMTGLLTIVYSMYDASCY